MKERKGNKEKAKNMRKVKRRVGRRVYKQQNNSISKGKASKKQMSFVP